MKSLEIKEKIHGKMHISYLRTLKNLIITLIFLEDYDSAYQNSLFGLEIKKDIFNQNDLEIAESLTNLAWIANKRKVSFYLKRFIIFKLYKI